MKYKYLTAEQINISIDRLTRFKFTKEKYLRVFTDIIISNLSDTKIKKQDLLCMSAARIRDMAVEIFNGSVENLASLVCSNPECKIPADDVNITNKEHQSSRFLNKVLEMYENSVFYNDKETQELLNNNINYQDALLILNGTVPVNLSWLKCLYDNKPDFSLIQDFDINSCKEYLTELREKYYLKYPVEKVLLVEGLTEEILLPAFSKYLGFDFYQKGIQIIPAGGKNQVVKMYYKLINELRIPIFLLLDRDAEENIRQIKPKLRNTDRIHLVSSGEFEDLLPKSLIIKTLNSHFANFNSVSENDFDSNLSTVKNLEYIFKSKGLHEFKKAEFAKLIRSNITEHTDISSEIIEIIKEISR